MPEILLKGCAPAPLAHYLKALGILRLVAEDAEHGDPQARGCWRGEHFVLESGLDEAGLLEFFLEHYRPTPIVAPWNGASGFYPKDNKAGIVTLGGSSAERFGPYRAVIETASQVVLAMGLSESPKDNAKQRLIATLRNCLPDHALQWLDAAVLVTADLRYPPLLGTGGNDGHLDFTNNHMQRLSELFDAATGKPSPGAPDLLDQALFGAPAAGLMNRAIGQFAPGPAGGPNSTLGFDGGARINPWDFVLMLEGAMLFAAAATRKWEQTGPGLLAYPFTVKSTGAGSGNLAGADEGNARSEIWLPLWEAMTSLAELRHLLAEGRASLGRRSARDGLDFARSVATLGVDRGIGAFQRSAFLMRSGKAYLATPLGRFVVQRNPQADLISDLDRYEWLDRLRRFARGDVAPNRVRSLVRRLEDALFALTRQAGASPVQEILCLLGELHLTLADSAKGREAVRPVARLSLQWVLKADDGSPAFRITAALAGIHAKRLPMRAHVLPIDDGGSWLAPGDARRALTVWASASLTRNLIAIQRRRLIEASREGQERKPFDSRLPVNLADVAAFLIDPGMDAAIARLLPGLVLCELPEALPSVEPATAAPIPAAYAVLRALFTPDRTLSRLGLLPDGTGLPLPAEVPALLAAGQTGRAVEIAWRRLRASGFPLPKAGRPPHWAGTDPQRLAATLTLPLAFSDTARLLRRLAEPQEQPV